MRTSDERYQVDPRHTALLAIDFQVDILTDGDGALHDWATSVVATAANLVSWCREAGIPIVWVRVVRRADYSDVFEGTTDLTLRAEGARPRRLREGTPGVDLVAPLRADTSDYQVSKRRVSAFYATHLEVYLRRLQVSTLLLAGVYTHMGVEATVRAAYDRDFESVVLADACGAPSQAIHDHALERVFPAMAVVRDLASLSV